MADPKAADILKDVKTVIAVASGKGGVGKSSVATNLACALQKYGTVGLVDIDFTGPSIPTMTGTTKQRATTKFDHGRKVYVSVPVEAHGLKLMSIGYFLDSHDPVVWRGAMIHSGVVQFFRDVVWGALDYLVVDTPPGSSDAHITLSQLGMLAGVVIVTTPQKVALADAWRCLKMFQKVHAPILGVVSNMDGFRCEHGITYDLFGRDGARQMAEAEGIPFLGGLEIDPMIRKTADSGIPFMRLKEKGYAGRPIHEQMREITTNVLAQVKLRTQMKGAA